MALSKEILEALKDPNTLEQIKKMGSDPELEELFGDVEFPEDATPTEIAKVINARSKKQMQYISKITSKSEEAAKRVLEEEKRSKRDIEISEFLKTHPDLASNDELIDVVQPLYNKYGDLQKAYDLGTKALGINPNKKEAVPPKEDKKEDKKEDEKTLEKIPKSQFKSDDPKLSDDPSKEGVEPTKPKSIREILSENSNKLTASGNNPFRENQ